MEITSLGFILIPLGLILFFFKNKYLLFIALFFAPFGAASVLNIEKITFGLQPSYYFGILFIVKEFLQVLKRMKIAKPNFWLLSFLIFSVFSMVMLVVFEGKIEVWYAEEGFYLLRLTSHNFTQVGYLLFCFFIYLFVKNFLRRVNDKEKLIKQLIIIQVFSLLFVSLWGIYQFAADYFSFPSPDIFVQREGVFISQAHLGSFLKINSTFPEPSMLAFYLIPMLAFIFVLPGNYLRTNKRSFFSLDVGSKLFLMAFIFIAGLFTISSSFLLGILVFLFLIFARFFSSLTQLENIRISQKRILYLIFIIFIILILVLVFSGRLEEIASLLLKNTVEKLRLKEFSGIDRLEQFLRGIKIFDESYFLGVGFGTIRTTDLFSTLLANVGIIGFLLFLCYLLSVYFRLRKSAKMGSVLSHAYIHYFLTLFIIAFASVPEIYFLFIWINLAIAEENSAIQRLSGSAKEQLEKFI